jgi:hypothetical protein
MALGMLALAARDTSSAPSGFSAYSIRGTYRVTFSGILLSSGQLESGIGIFIADGSGHISGTEVFSGGGKVCRDVAVTGTYTVGGNGIGAFSADFTSLSAGCSGHFNSALLLVDGGDVIHSVSTDTDFVTVAEEWRRQAE